MNEFLLRPSLGAVRWVFIVHLMAVALMLITVERNLPLALLAAGAGISWFWLRRHAVFGFGPRALTGVRHRDDGWQARLGNGEWRDASLAPATRLFGRGVLLVLRINGRRHTRLVRGTDLAPDAMRQLRIAVIETQRDAGG